MPRGFTLVETLVALLLLELGMLALAATSAVVARDLAVAHRTLRAQTLARNRLELVATNPCAAVAGAATLPGRYDMSWTVKDVGRRREVSVSVGFAVSRGRRRVVALRTAALCP